MNEITLEYVGSILKKRKNDTHKGDYGKLLIVAGSDTMTGAAVLCAQGALRSGTGLVYLCVPRSLFPIFQIAVPEAICVDRSLEISFSKYDSIVFGPGLGLGDDIEDNRDLLERILASFDGSIVIDADGLNIVSRFRIQDRLRDARPDIVITPHMGEAKRLLRELPDARRQVADALYAATGAISIIKGDHTIVRGTDAYVNTTGNPGMATAGSGDVLSGIIGSLLGQGYEPEEAARAGVFIHGLAGDIAAEEIGQWGLIARDIANDSSKAIQRIIGE